MKTAERHTGAPPRSGLPQASCAGQSVFADPGGHLFYSNFYEHICLYSDSYGHKLIPEKGRSLIGCVWMGINAAKECLGHLTKSISDNITTLACVLYNSYVCLRKCKIMDINKQHIVLNLIRSKRYELNHETGDIISNCGLEPRVLKPIKHYTGYLQYRLDIGFNGYIMVYGQGFSYLAKHLTPFNPMYVIDHIDKNKGNNRPDNLRCITEQENTAGNFNGRHGLAPGFRRKRLPVDQKTEIIELHKQGISFVKLAERYEVTRQTIAAICSVK